MTNEKQKAACHQSVKLGWKHYPVGIGTLLLICGKRDFAILRNSRIKRVIPKFLRVTKQQMDIVSVYG